MPARYKAWLKYCTWFVTVRKGFANTVLTGPVCQKRRAGTGLPKAGGSSCSQTIQLLPSCFIDVFLFLLERRHSSTFAVLVEFEVVEVDEEAKISEGNLKDALNEANAVAVE